MKNTIGTNVKRLLEERKMTQADLARKSGISTANISLIVNGKRNIRLHTLRLLCDALGCGSEEIIGGVDDER